MPTQLQQIYNGVLWKGSVNSQNILVSNLLIKCVNYMYTMTTEYNSCAQFETEANFINSELNKLFDSVFQKWPPLQ